MTRATPRPSPVVRRARRLVRRLFRGRRPGTLPAWAGPATTLPPLLVGGTGRSGTTITGRLLGEHRDYYMIPFEVRFMTDRGGLCDLVAGRCTMGKFRKRVLRRWFDRGPGVGLHEIATRRLVRAALRELDRGLRNDPARAAERFVHRLLDPPTLAAGARGWVEMTPGVALWAGELLAILPAARLVHIVRDGRDVACSVVPLWWGPQDLDAALDWWSASLQQAYAATAVAPPDRVFTLRMEDLLDTDRSAQYDRLRTFAGLDDDPGMRAFFEQRATAEGAHIGRWRDEIPPEAQEAFGARYRSLAEPLAEQWGYEPVSGTAGER